MRINTINRTNSNNSNSKLGDKFASKLIFTSKTIACEKSNLIRYNPSFVPSSFQELIAYVNQFKKFIIKIENWSGGREHLIEIYKKEKGVERIVSDTHFRLDKPVAVKTYFPNKDMHSYTYINDDGSYHKIVYRKKYVPISSKQAKEEKRSPWLLRVEYFNNNNELEKIDKYNKKGRIPKKTSRSGTA